ncbi:beta-galactosidase [Cohnella lupini]|uniref:Beta-galactosidase-like protein n=1 Tax=Cohnella lupini TaxID=1294267 RepID=A0A3D9I0L8_9BACL|nr:beta-galactosidase [Cohnella lupini]RED55284.1 beta-galactosidase-like protein [Cohnella lupini]
MTNRYFTTSRKEDGSWSLLDPNGKPFFSLGVNCVFLPDSLSSAKMQEYGDDGSWFPKFADRKLEQIREYGFNTLAAWHEKYYWGNSFPKTIELRMSQHANKVNVDWGFGFPDVFCSSFVYSVQRVLSEHFYGEGRMLKDDPSLIGYYTDNELHWWGKGGQWGMDDMKLGADPANLVQDYFELPSHAPGKQRWVRFLKERYGDIDRLNEAWSGEYWEFDDLLTIFSYTAETEAFEQDKLDFLKLIAETYYGTTTSLLKTYDSDHLVLGCRLVGASTPEVVLEVMGQYLDVVSLNFYTRHFPEKWLTRVANLTGKPVMVTEFSFCAGRQAGYLSSTNGAQHATVKDQKRRGQIYDMFIKKAAAFPSCVGAHWFALYDFNSNRHPLNGNYGLLTADDKPWEEFTASVTATHREVLSADLIES